MKIISQIIIVMGMFGFLYPCSCTEPPPPEEAFGDADIVFSGLVTNIVLDETGYYYEVTFQIIDIWKGEDLEDITVLTETDSDTCGYNFQINLEYLVYAYNYNLGIYTNICTRTNLLEYTSEDLEFLNGLDNQYLGDINDDGDINIQDVILLVNLVLNNEYNDLADINQDDELNILDVVQIVNIILYGPIEGECVEEDYSTVGILTNLNGEIYNSDESVNEYSIYSWVSNQTDRILSGNGIPNHEIGTFPNPNCPNTISEQNVSKIFPLFPILVSDEGDYGVGGPNGAPAYALNSVKFDPATAGTCNNNGVCTLAQGQGQWNIEALGHDTFDFGDDMNHAHVQPSGAYHYHGIPAFLLDFLGQEEDMTLIGWASDGFPVYVQYGYSDACDYNSGIIAPQPSWRLKDEPDPGRPDILTELTGGPGGGQTDLNIPIPMGAFTQDFEYVEGYGDLDQCNGRIGVTPEFPDGIYYYMVTDEFPYFSRCLKGEFSSGNGGGGGGNPPDCEDVPPGLPCCGDNFCGGPENSTNCPEDCP